MNIKRHLIYTCVDIKVSRMYGGCDYTVQVWEFVRKGRLRYLGEARRCNRAHCGCMHEAWKVAQRDKIIARAAKRAGFDIGSYWDYSAADKAGWVIERVGTTVG